jgi:hypothetical protein
LHTYLPLTLGILPMRLSVLPGRAMT